MYVVLMVLAFHGGRGGTLGGGEAVQLGVGAVACLVRSVDAECVGGLLLQSDHPVAHCRPRVRVLEPTYRQHTNKTNVATVTCSKLPSNYCEINLTSRSIEQKFRYSLCGPLKRSLEECGPLKRLAYSLYGSVASLPSPSSNIEA